MAACSFQQYQAKPIDAQTNLVRLAEKDPNSLAFQQFLIKHGYKADQLPVQAWGLEELIYCALFFHPSLDLAKAKSKAKELSLATAASSPIPTVNTKLARSNDPDPAKKPYALGLSIDLPIDIANKSEIRVENAKYLADIAQLQLAQTAWELRDSVAQTWLDYQAKQEQIRLLSIEQNHLLASVAIYKKRVELGLNSNVELSSANLKMQANAVLLNQTKQQSHTLYTQLSSHVGLPLAQFNKLVLKSGYSAQPAEAEPLAVLQKNALLNRLDLRIALLRYASMEAKLKLEIANQYPDLVISPGYAYEFGDSVWSLGLSGLLTLLQKNKLAIAEAEQLREVEAAAFEVLQTKIIGDTNTANATFAQAQQLLKNQQALLVQQQANEKRMHALFAAGEIDRLTLTLAKLETIAIEKSAATAQYDLNTAIRQLENTLQKPLTGPGVAHEP